MGRDVTYLADVYAFGILLFELLTGDKPITGDNVEQLFARILHEQVDLTPLRQAGVPEPVCNLVGRCIAKAPADRPQGLGIVRRELEQVLEPPPPPPAPACRFQPQVDASGGGRRGCGRGSRAVLRLASKAGSSGG